MNTCAEHYQQNFIIWYIDHLVGKCTMQLQHQPAQLYQSIYQMLNVPCRLMQMQMRVDDSVNVLSDILSGIYPVSGRHDRRNLLSKTTISNK